MFLQDKHNYTKKGLIIAEYIIIIELTPTAPEISSLKASFLTLNNAGGSLLSIALKDCIYGCHNYIDTHKSNSLSVSYHVVK